jgi:hypothetical protein
MCTVISAKRRYCILEKSCVIQISHYKKKQSCPATRHGGRKGERRYSSYSYLISALDGGEWSASRPGRALPREKDPGTHCTGGWVDPRDGLDPGDRRKILCPVGDRTAVVQPVVRHYTAWAIAVPQMSHYKNINSVGTNTTARLSSPPLCQSFVPSYHVLGSVICKTGPRYENSVHQYFHRVISKQRNENTCCNRIVLQIRMYFSTLVSLFSSLKCFSVLHFEICCPLSVSQTEVNALATRQTIGRHTQG